MDDVIRRAVERTLAEGRRRLEATDFSAVEARVLAHMAAAPAPGYDVAGTVTARLTGRQKNAARRAGKVLAHGRNYGWLAR